MVRGAAALEGPMTYACADEEFEEFEEFFYFHESTGLGAQI